MMTKQDASEMFPEYEWGELQGGVLYCLISPGSKGGARLYRVWFEDSKRDGYDYCAVVGGRHRIYSNDHNDLLEKAKRKVSSVHSKVINRKLLGARSPSHIEFHSPCRKYL